MSNTTNTSAITLIHQDQSIDHRMYAIGDLSVYLELFECDGILFVEMPHVGRTHDYNTFVQYIYGDDVSHHVELITGDQEQHLIDRVLNEVIAPFSIERGLCFGGIVYPTFTPELIHVPFPSKNEVQHLPF